MVLENVMIQFGRSKYQILPVPFILFSGTNGGYSHSRTMTDTPYVSIFDASTQNLLDVQFDFGRRIHHDALATLRYCVLRFPPF